MTMIDTQEALKFMNVIVDEMNEYSLTTNLIKNNNNITANYNDINKDCLIILFNDEARGYLNSNSRLSNFLTRCKERNSLIWPVAMDKKKRKPHEFFLEFQSFDVYDQLRGRKLTDEYLPIIAKNFSRTIIAQVLPTMYREKLVIFLSHRRIDGEDITANLCNSITQSSKLKAFRDVKEVRVGNRAQCDIDEAMLQSDVFIFIHTQEAGESNWIQKELRFAILRRIPVLWVNIDDANIQNLKIKPTENPHLKYKSSDFKDKPKLDAITDEILDKIFYLIMNSANIVYDMKSTLYELLQNNISPIDQGRMMYSIDVERKGYQYPQRNIKQYIQLFGRTPVAEDTKALLGVCPDELDSAVILTNRIVKKSYSQNIVTESFDDFLYNWKSYIFPKNNKTNNKKIIISGAFPDGDEIFKQSLTDAIIIFAKCVLREGYTLTFGSHPTFQEIFFEIAKEAYPQNTQNHLKMYISKWFKDKYDESTQRYSSNANLVETDKFDTVEDSLLEMRKKMIQSNSVSALVCLGGKVKQDKNCEGIRQEIKLAQEDEVPVFIVGSVGGCSSVVASELNVSGFHLINHASLALNQVFASSTDYLMMTQKMLNYLNNNLE